ncbi:hypothetical protein COU80_02825 [Candidatus Peregrinibacteria bacterium CG10_big_fil_rev_8_21_14_0_10_55_24]|nr:MAG: hypothetical protein COU80_02825 [Candidatus Peregrinibacteria bacterium CG10_big_fil_rev_8_21_14_0_10_55_24]
MSKESAMALDFAREVAQEAAEFLVEEQKKIRPETAGANLGIATKSSPRDFVTAVDRESQRRIIARLHEFDPAYRFVAEEDGAEALGDPSCPFAWIVDPLDGTTPFIHNRDNFGVIIALQKEGITQCGVTCVPRRKELFHGIRGGGAFFNNTPVRLRHTRNMNDAILCSNLIHRIQDINGIPMVTVPRCANVENYGSAAQEIGEVLKGCNDGVFFLGPRLWDIAAGFLMIEEAGGRSEYVFEEPGNVRSAIRGLACTAEIFEELRGFVFEQMGRLT